MSLRTRLRQLERSVGPPPAPLPELTPEEIEQRLRWWLGGQTYNRGVFDAEPEFRPAWSHYHRLWEIYTQGWSPLQAVWLAREQPDFEEARRRVVAIMLRVLRQQPAPARVLAAVLEVMVPEPAYPTPKQFLQQEPPI
jgi:hypothetical protein